jgi:DNA repair protein RadD
MRVLDAGARPRAGEQNFLAPCTGCGRRAAGIYSAGLGRRDAHHRITFASIQSVYRTPAPRPARPGAGRRGAPDPRPPARACTARCSRPARDGAGHAGLRLHRHAVPDGQGRLDEGDDRLFDEIVYTYGVGEGIADGWLSPLISKGGRQRD